MDVNKTEAVAPTGSTTARPQQRNADERGSGKGAKKDPQAGGAQLRREPERDAVSILGIPAASLTPEGERAITGMMAELDTLRQELAWARERHAHLEALADSHDFLPALNRRAFFRKLNNVLAHAGQLGSPACLLVLSVLNADNIRRRLGRRALEAVLEHVCRTVSETLHPTDVLAALGGGDFAVILLVGDAKNTARLREVLPQSVAERPPVWEGAEVVVQIAIGARTLEAGIDAQAAMVAADRDLLNSLETNAGGVSGKAVSPAPQMPPPSASGRSGAAPAGKTQPQAPPPPPSRPPFKR